MTNNKDLVSDEWKSIDKYKGLKFGQMINIAQQRF